MFKCKMNTNTDDEAYLAWHTLSPHKHADIHGSTEY